MEEELRPAFKEVASAQGLAFVLLWLLISAMAFLLPMPSSIQSTVAEVAGLIIVASFFFKVSNALGLYWEERYYVGEGVLRIRRSAASTTAITVLLQNVTQVTVKVPFFMRPFRVGTVWVYTADCLARPLFNLKDPLAVAEKIRPEYHYEGTFRPSVG